MFVVAGVGRVVGSLSQLQAAPSPREGMIPPALSYLIEHCSFFCPSADTGR